MIAPEIAPVTRKHQQEAPTKILEFYGKSHFQKSRNLRDLNYIQSFFGSTFSKSINEFAYLGLVALTGILFSVASDTLMIQVAEVLACLLLFSKFTSLLRSQYKTKKNRVVVNYG